MTLYEKIEELTRLYNGTCDRHNYRLANTIRGWILDIINDSPVYPEILDHQISHIPNKEYNDELLGQGRR